MSVSSFRFAVILWIRASFLTWQFLCQPVLAYGLKFDTLGLCPFRNWI